MISLLSVDSDRFGYFQIFTFHLHLQWLIEWIVCILRLITLASECIGRHPRCHFIGQSYFDFTSRKMCVYFCIITAFKVTAPAVRQHLALIFLQNMQDKISKACQNQA